jgi:hypothetical protein
MFSLVGIRVAVAILSHSVNCGQFELQQWGAKRPFAQAAE